MTSSRCYWGSWMEACSAWICRRTAASSLALPGLSTGAGPAAARPGVLAAFCASEGGPACCPPPICRFTLSSTRSRGRASPSPAARMTCARRRSRRAQSLAGGKALCCTSPSVPGAAGRNQEPLHGTAQEPAQLQQTSAAERPRAHLLRLLSADPLLHHQLQKEPQPLLADLRQAQRGAGRSCADPLPQQQRAEALVGAGRGRASRRAADAAALARRARRAGRRVLGSTQGGAAGGAPEALCAAAQAACRRLAAGAQHARQRCSGGCQWRGRGCACCRPCCCRPCCRRCWCWERGGHVEVCGGGPVRCAGAACGPAAAAARRGERGRR